MTAVDFIYDGIYLSSLGYMIGYLDDVNALDTVGTDSQRSFGSFSLFGGKWQPLTVAYYKDSLRIGISIVKNPCNGDDMSISLSEIRAVKRWLNRPTYHELRICDDDYDGIFWMGSGNVEEVHNAGRCVGFNVTFYTDRPFALCDEKVFSGEVSGSGTVIIDDSSDEIGYIYPTFDIKVLSSGNLNITNSFDERVTVIKNCVANERINMTKVMQITSSTRGHAIGDDFNWKFPRICNDIGKTENGFMFSLPCEYSIKYNPIVKAVIA